MKRRYLAYLFFITLLVLGGAEAFLRLTGRYATYPEAIGLKYTSYYNASYPTWYITRSPNDTFIPPNTDFQYPYSINSLGLREKNFEKNKKDSTIRIFATGDSFSEGQGAPYDSTWPHLLSRYLANDGLNAEVLNTGVAGSDPVYNYVFHRDILKGYKADYVIISINSSDFTDYMLRGGFERFLPDGTTHYTKGPWYEPLYHHSFFARGFIEWVGQFPFRGIFSNEHDFAVSADRAMECYGAVVDSFSNLLRPDSTRIIVLMYSTPSDIRYQNNEMKIFRQSFISLQKQLAVKNIPCINLWDDLKSQLANENYKQYTYDNDSHYKPYGYNLMAQVIEKNLIEKGIITRK
jgi:hypothetical protein